MRMRVIRGNHHDFDIEFSKPVGLIVTFRVKVS